jgi:uncharacterized protein (TIGR02145 family)/uncharacterized repeat protein (TIGR02543 family)
MGSQTRFRTGTTGIRAFLKIAGIAVLAAFLCVGCGDKNNSQPDDKKGASYVITFDPNGGTLPSYTSDTTRANGKLASLPTPEYDSHDFDGWFTADSGGAKVDTNYVFTKDTTVYAQWTKKNTAGIDTSKTDTTGTDTTDTDTTGTDTTGTDTTGTDTTGTDTTGTDTTGTDSTGVDSTETPDTYIIEFEANDGTVTPTSGETGENGKLASLPTPSKTGYTFAGWYTAETDGAAEVDTGTVFENDATIYALWTINKYRVTFNSQGGGAVPPQDEVAYNTNAAEPTPPPTRAGYTFDGWYRENTSTAAEWNFADDVVKGPTTLHAKWTINKYIVTFNSRGGSAVPPQNDVTYNTKAAEPTPAPTRSGYTFGGWYKDNTYTAALWNFAADAVTGPTTLYAKWTAEPDPSFAGQSGNFTDSRDGTTYQWTKIGTQVWMAENLNYDAAGSVCYENSADSCEKYGRLYNWMTAMGLSASYYGAIWEDGDVLQQGACPVGWHVPNDGEWTALVIYANTLNSASFPNNSGTRLKAADGWSSGNGTDYYGFAALPGGFGDGSDGSFTYSGTSGYWWNATERGVADYERYAIVRQMGVGEAVFKNSAGNPKNDLFSVRCVKD